MPGAAFNQHIYDVPAEHLRRFISDEVSAHPDRQRLSKEDVERVHVLVIQTYSEAGIVGAVNSAVYQVLVLEPR